jgi:phage I-like protein
MVTPSAEPQDEGITPETTVEQSTAEDTPARTFTQEELNRFVGNARRDERSKFADHSDLLEKAKKLEEMEQAQLSEQEKLTQRASEAERREADARAKVESTAISSAVKVRAIQLGIVDPDAAYLLMDRASVSYDAENDTVNGIDDALNLLLDDKPYLKNNAVRSPNINPEGGQVAPVTRLSTEQKEAARLMGLSEEEYAQGL